VLAVLKGEPFGELEGFDNDELVEDFASCGDDFESSLLEVEFVVSRKSLEKFK